MTETENHEESKEAEDTDTKEPVEVTIAETELEALKNELKEYKEKYLLVLAESENARKRMQKERQDLIQFAIQNIIVEFLTPLDHLENALSYTENMSKEIQHWAHGFNMILDQFKDVLATNGVKSIEAKGKHFDPHFHEAVETIDTDEHPPGTIVEENVKGYIMGDRTIRPARVKVAKAPEKPNSKAEGEEVKAEEQKS